MSTLQEQFNRDGYVLLRNYLDKGVINEIYTEARKIFPTQIKRVTGKTVDIDNRDTFENAMFEFFEKDFDGFVSTGKTVQHAFSLHRLGVDSVIENLLKD